MATPKELADAVVSALGILKSIDSRYQQKLTTVRAPDAKTIHALLGVIGTSDMGVIVAAGAKGGTSAPNAPPSAVDTQAPFAPLARSLPGVGYIDHTFIPVADQPLGTDPSDGIKEYRRVTDGGAQVVVSASQSAPNNKNQHARPTIAAVGGATTSGSFSGRTLTLRSTGTGYDWNSTSDQGGIAYLDDTDFGCAVVSVSSVATISGSPNAYGKIGLLISAGTAANSPYLCACHFLSADSKGGEISYRDVAGTARQQFATFVGDGSYGKFVVEKTGTVVTVWRLSAANVWTALVTSQTLPWLTGSLRISALVTPVAAGATIEAVMDVWYTSEAAYTYRQTTSSNARTFKVLARDNTLNDSTYSNTTTTDPLTTPPPADAMKFAPNLWPQWNGIVPRVADTSLWATIRQFYVDMAAQKSSYSNLKGVSFITYWGCIADHSGSASWAAGDAIMNALIALSAEFGIPFQLHVWPRKFTNAALPSTPQSGNSPAFPDWLLDAGQVAAAVPAQFLPQQAKLWVDQVGTWYANMYVHFYTTYNHSKWWHGFETEESSDGDWPGYNATVRWAQWTKLVDAVAPVATNTPMILTMNWASPFDQTGVTSMRNLIAHAYSLGKFGFGGPDMYDPTPGHYATMGESIYRGLGTTIPSSVYGSVIDFGTVQYGPAGLAQIQCHHEYISDFDRVTLWTYSHDVLSQTHLVYRVIPPGQQAQNGGTITAQNGWGGADGVNVYLGGKGANVTRTACPTAFGALCSTNFGD